MSSHNEIDDQIGFIRDERCNRNGCAGIIEKRSDAENSCKCFKNPPCSWCTDENEFCPLCGWDYQDE